MGKYSNRTNIKIVSDNLELIKRNKKHMNYKNPEQIYLTNQTYQINTSFQHVYGHQDTRLRGEVTMEANLNVEADQLAGLYQDELGAYSPITHMYPLSPGVLEIDGTTITSNIHHQLINEYSEPKYNPSRSLSQKQGFPILSVRRWSENTAYLVLTVNKVYLRQGAK